MLLLDLAHSSKAISYFYLCLFNLSSQMEGGVCVSVIRKKTAVLYFSENLFQNSLSLIYFSSQSPVDMGNKQYALWLPPSNLECTVINLNNVSQTGLCSLMTPDTPLGILARQNLWSFSGQISHNLVYEPDPGMFTQAVTWDFGPAF